MRITTCSVTVMRSHDYCHFSVTLGAVEDPGLGNPPGIATVDDLRKEAARLADKAVEQYKIKKRALEESDSYTFREAKVEAAKACETPEAERTPEQQAAVKLYGDMLHRSRYDYDDGWDERDES